MFSVVVHVVIHKELGSEFMNLLPDFAKYATKEHKGNSIYLSGEVNDSEAAVIIDFVKSHFTKSFVITHDEWTNINLVNGVFYEEHGDYGDNPDFPNEFHIYGDMCIMKNNVPEMRFYEGVVRDLIQRNPDLTQALNDIVNSIKEEAAANIDYDYKNEDNLNPTM